MDETYCTSIAAQSPVQLWLNKWCRSSREDGHKLTWSPGAHSAWPQQLASSHPHGPRRRYTNRPNTIYSRGAAAEEHGRTGTGGAPFGHARIACIRYGAASAGSWTWHGTCPNTSKAKKQTKNRQTMALVPVSVCAWFCFRKMVVWCLSVCCRWLGQGETRELRERNGRKGRGSS